ncbi:MAG: hypothetical protein VYD51_02580 [Bacteroidota bacterium]|nr:hypothetical protein [Bacteroidota bacterium]
MNGTPFSAHALRVSVLWLLLGCGVSVGTWGQSLVISGTVRNEDTRDKMDNVTVTVLQNGEAFDQIDVDRNGKYFLDVPLRSDYIIEFSAPDMVTKRVQIDGAAVPPSELNDGFTFDLDMSLFAYVEGFDESLLDTPIGIATFNERSARIEFDLSHTNDMRRKVANELDRVANLEEDLARARMRYDNAMEDGERAEARGRWEDAYDEYEKALSFIPGDEAATAGMGRAEAALNADAEAEAAALAEEQAAAQAAAQAEADARAAEEQAAREAEAASRAAEEEAARAADAAARAEEAAARAEESRRQAEADREALAAEEAAAAAAQEAAQQEMAADVEAAEDARKARERAWEEEQAAREAERLARQQEAKSRAQNWSQRTSKTEDEAEAYYRQALQSERQAAAAEVQGQKDEVTSQNDRWRAEAEGRAAQARRQSSTLDNGVRQINPKDVQDAYPGREPEHRQERAAVLEEIEALKRANNALKSMRAEGGRNRVLDAMLDLDMQVAVSQEQGQDLALSSEDRDIPQGVQETSYDIQNGLVIQRTVRIGDVVERYRKVVTKTGTYYFRGDKSITKDLWEMNTNLSYD